MINVFISRALTPDSPFFQEFPKGGDVFLVAESLIAFAPVRFHHLPAFDWVFFSSPNAVRFFFAQWTEQQQNWLPQWRIGVLGDGTARALKEFGRSADFAGNGDLEAVIPAFRVLASGSRVLCPRAQHSRESIQQGLQGVATVLDLVVYDNQPRRDIELPFCEILVFTSPLNVTAYFQRYPLDLRQHLLAIGPTTEKALRELGPKEVWVAATPSEAALSHKTREIIREKGLGSK